MNTESPRIRALLAGAAALVVFGITVPATATDGDTGGKPPAGSVGSAGDKADPKGQYKNDKNNGFTCDGNGGVGGGNPALNPDCGGATDTGTGTGPGTGDSEPWTNPDA